MPAFAPGGRATRWRVISTSAATFSMSAPPRGTCPIASSATVSAPMAVASWAARVQAAARRGTQERQELGPFFVGTDVGRRLLEQLQQLGPLGERLPGDRQPL